MSTIIVASPEPRAGKTALACALALLSQRAGHHVDYLLAGGGTSAQDPQATFLSTLTGSPSSHQQSNNGHGRPLQVEEAATTAREQGNLLLVELPGPTGDPTTHWQECLRMARAADATLLVVIRSSSSQDITQLQAALDPLKSSLGGLLANLIPPYRTREATQGLSSISGALGVPTLAVVPQDRLMAAPTIGHLAELLNAHWLMGQEKADSLVCHVLIGGNPMDPGTLYFGRHEDQAVIVRGDRPDVQLAALSCPPACLVLTGGHQPIQYVYYEAQEREVPLLVVDEDTLATAETLATLMDRASIYHPRKAHRFLQLLEELGDINALSQIVAQTP